MRLVWSLAICIENIGIVRPDRVGHDILIDFIAQDIIGGLIDLNDFLNPAVDVVRK